MKNVILMVIVVFALTSPCLAVETLTDSDSYASEAKKLMDQIHYEGTTLSVDPNKKHTKAEKETLYKKALNLINKAIQLNPQETDYQFRKAVILGELKKHKEAIKLLSDLIIIEPDYANYRLRAEYYFKTGDKLNAFKDIDKCIEVAGVNKYLCYYDLAEYYYNNKQTNQALVSIDKSIDTCKEYINANPSSTWACDNFIKLKSKIYQQSGNWKSAVEILQQYHLLADIEEVLKKHLKDRYTILEYRSLCEQAMSSRNILDMNICENYINIEHKDKWNMLGRVGKEMWFVEKSYIKSKNRVTAWVKLIELNKTSIYDTKLLSRNVIDCLNKSYKVIDFENYENNKLINSSSGSIEKPIVELSISPDSLMDMVLEKVCKRN